MCCLIAYTTTNATPPLPTAPHQNKQGDPGDLFYIIKDGEAVVYQKTEQGEKKVNHLFKSDFFGERALLSNEPRTATVEAKTKLVCLTLDRKTFVEVLGPLEDIMNREKSPEVCRLMMVVVCCIITTTPTHDTNHS